MRLKWSKFINVFLSLLSILAGIWIIVVLFHQLSLRRNVSVDQTVREESGNLPLTSLEIAEATLELGEVVRGDTLEVSFRIRNIGKEDLVINRVRPDCSCTEYKLIRQRIPENEDTELWLNISTDHKHGPQQIHTVIESNTKEGFHIMKVQFDVIEP